MIDYEQLKAAIDTKLSTDPEFRTIMKRVTAGRATFIDTSRYSEVIAHALGQELSKYVLELTDREAITKQLLHDNYEDINDVFGRVQRDIDKKKGLTLKPQQAPFPEERVEQYAHSLLDPTVEDNVIKRRARAGSETITKSFHDDCIEKNAEFHEEAGLKCYIIRMGTNCCQWCSDVAGKYEMKDQPEGIFRRHDNCNCTVIYDGQVLRGQAGNNGKSSKKWVEVSNNTGAAETTRLSQEQANRLNNEKVKFNKPSIDKTQRDDIIELKNKVPATEQEKAQFINNLKDLGFESVTGFEKYTDSNKYLNEMLEDFKKLKDDFPEYFDGLKLDLGVIDTITDDVYACYVIETGTIHLNPLYYNDFHKFKSMYASDVNGNFHPSGTNYRANIYHEFGHRVEHIANIKPKSTAKEAFEMNNSFYYTRKMCDSWTNKNLSRYAYMFDYDDFISESFAEYYNSQQPRALCKQIVELCLKRGV